MCAGDAVEVRGEGGVEIRVIEKVVGFGAELALGGFGDADVAEAGSGDGVAGGRCRSVERGGREHRGIEPLLCVLRAIIRIAGDVDVGLVA